MPDRIASSTVITARALQLGESVDVKGLEREDAFSTNPLAFRMATNGTVMLFRSGAAVFFSMTPVEEEGLIQGLVSRIKGAVHPREIETAKIRVCPNEDDSVSAVDNIHVKKADPTRLLLVGEALAVSVALAYDERRIATAFERIEPMAASLMGRRLPRGPQSALLEQIGEALIIQQRLAGGQPHNLYLRSRCRLAPLHQRYRDRRHADHNHHRHHRNLHRRHSHIPNPERPLC